MKNAFTDPLIPIQLLRQAFLGHLEPIPTSITLPDECVGLSGQNFRSFTQHLVKNLQIGSYLEIGVYKGFTILNSAIRNPEKPHIGVDNFSQFDAAGVNKGIIHKGSEKIKNLELVDMDYEDFLASPILPSSSVGVYFFDATHDYRSQFIGVALGRKLLLPGAVILVDDANYHHVRYACYDIMDVFPEIKLLGEIFTPKHPNKMTFEQKRDCLKGWWNGCIVMQFDPDGCLPKKCLEPQKSIAFRSMITTNLHKGRSGYDTSSMKSVIY